MPRSENIDNPADVYITKLSPAIEMPPLKIARSGNNLLIIWPTNFSGFVLESAVTLDGGTNSWSKANVTPLVLAGRLTVIQKFPLKRNPSDSGDRERQKKIFARFTK